MNTLNRTVVTLAALAALVFAGSGAIYAAEPAGAGPAGDLNRQPAAQDASGCHDASVIGATALPFEAPWISLALENRERIGLSEEQARTLDKLRSDFQSEAERSWRDIASAEQALQGLLAQDTVDVGSVREQLDTVGRRRDTLRLRRIETLLAGRAVLSAEQLAGLQSLLTRRAGMMHGAMGDGGSGQVPSEPSAGTM